MSDYSLARPMKYKGQIYRSQAECHWARLMDEVGIRAEYEKRLYELPDGTRYLPDFLLRGVKRFVEIKNTLGATNSEVATQAALKAHALARCLSHHVVVIDGRPANATAYVFDGSRVTDLAAMDEDPLVALSSKQIYGQSNPLPILRELIQPTDAGPPKPVPSHFQYGLRQRVKNLDIAPDYEPSYYNVDPDEIAAYDRIAFGLTPQKLGEP